LPIGKFDDSWQNRATHFAGGFDVAAFLFTETPNGYRLTAQG